MFINQHLDPNLTIIIVELPVKCHGVLKTAAYLSAFWETPYENFNTFSDIYDIKFVKM